MWCLSVSCEKIYRKQPMKQDPSSTSYSGAIPWVDTFANILSLYMSPLSPAQIRFFLFSWLIRKQVPLSVHYNLLKTYTRVTKPEHYNFVSIKF